MTNDNREIDASSRRAGWVHHPGLDVCTPLDQDMQLPLATGAEPLRLHLIYTDDGLYVPVITCRPPGAGPFPTVIVIHGGSGGLGIPYLVDHAVNQAWAVERLIAHGYAVVLAEGRCEIEDAYDTDLPCVLDHHDMITVFRYVCRQPWAAPGSVGFFGVSHGGEMQMKIVSDLASDAAAPVPAALAMCEPAVIEFLGLKYQGVRKEANLQFHAPVADTQIDIARARERIARIPVGLPMLVVGRDEDHLQGLFAKLADLLQAAGKSVEWASFSHPEHAYQLGPRRGENGYRPDLVQEATLAHVIGFLDRHLKSGS